MLLAATRIICFRVAFETSLMSLLGVFPAYDRTPAFEFFLLHNQSNFYRSWYHGTDAARGGDADH